MAILLFWTPTKVVNLKVKCKPEESCFGPNPGVIISMQTSHYFDANNLTAFKNVDDESIA